MTIGGRPRGRVTGPRIRGTLTGPNGPTVAPPRTINITLSGTFNGTGDATAAHPGPDHGRRWRLTRAISVTTETIGSAHVRHYRGSVSDATYLDGSSYAREDVSEYPTPVTIHAGDPIITVWTDGTPSQTGTVTLTVIDEPAT